MRVCYFCGHELDCGSIIGRREICPRCHRDVRCCFNCGHHQPGAANQCSEPNSEAPRERDRSNFCDFFIVRDSRVDTAGANEMSKAREELKRLFKKNP